MKSVYDKIFGCRVSPVEMAPPSIETIDLTNIDIATQMMLIRQWETATYPLFAIGNVLQTLNYNTRFYFCTGPDTYFGAMDMPPDTKFVVASRPTMNEGGGYQAFVLVDGREALVDIYQFYERIKLA